MRKEKRNIVRVARPLVNASGRPPYATGNRGD
jgi:hypothetical protein